MTITYEIDEGERLIIERAEGPIDLDQVISFLERRNADPRFCGLHHGIADLRRAVFDFPAREMERFRAVYRQQGCGHGPRRWAVLADSRREVALLMLMEETWAELGLEVELFATEEAARTYLGL